MILVEVADKLRLLSLKVILFELIQTCSVTQIMIPLQSLTNLITDTNQDLDQKLKETDNIIRITRKIIQPMSETQRFDKAKAHIYDALAYRHPRPESQSLDTPQHFKYLYAFHTSSAWQWLLFALGYVFMYMVIADNERYAAKIAVESTILLIFWADTLISHYINLFDGFRKNKHSSLFYFKVVLLTLMTVDLIIFIILPGYDSRPIRPFRILRCFIPMLYDSQNRKSHFALASAYTDITVYLIFFSIIIGGWALVGSRSLTFNSSYRDPKFPQTVDPYKNDITNLGHMIFVVYVTATYDSYPDNQIIVIQNYEPNYIFFIVFIFMNMFLFSSIPGSLIYQKFRRTRSKIILIDEIRQQHSLILAFVTLAEDSKNLSMNKLIKFLNYLYRYKLRYVQYITEICLKLDDNNNKSIQVNEFMQLSKIILQNKSMTPPAFDDVKIWVSFRQFMKTRLHIKFIVHHWLFQLIATILIILSFINALFLIYNYSTLVDTFDTIFTWVFLAELILRVIGYGPESFFADRWNNLDAFLVIISVVFFFILDANNASGSIARMGRIFRLARLLRIISHSNFLEGVKLRVFDKLAKLFTVILEIMPIILKFMPLFMFFFYIFSIAGMEIFYNSYTTQGSPAYNQYNQFSSFRTFIQAHYIMVQVLTEAGWSMVAFDHSWRNAQYYGYIMIYFCFMHIIIVYIIATLIKGIFWQVYFTVNQIFQDRENLMEKERLKQEKNQERTKEITQINELIAAEEYIDPDTILKRQLFENKLDSLIFRRLKRDRQNQNYKQTMLRSPRKVITSKKYIMSKIVKDYEIPLSDLQVSEDMKDKYLRKTEKEIEGEESRSKLALEDIEELAEEDFQSEIQMLFHHIIINPKARFSYIIGSNKIFLDFLKAKLLKPQNFIAESEFDLNKNPIHNAQSIQLHIYEMNSLLNIEISKRQQKAVIIKSLRDDGIIDDNLVEKLIKKKLYEQVFRIDTNGTLRQLFLSETNENLIRKFQVEYFSDLYGYSFKQINKMTLEPLLKVEATLTYTLRNILRYPQIDNIEFFQLFTHIEDQFSNNILKKGSLFKFIYKLDAIQQIWFSIQFKSQQDMRVHFIKTGVWCYSNQMEDNQVYYARDVFKWDLWGREDSSMCEKFLKRFYQSFQGLAFSLLDQSKFFQSTPNKYVYDLYVQCFDAEKVKRFISREMEISKIMVVILSKEEERRDIGQKQLPYSLSDLTVPRDKERPTMEFTFDDTENDTYQKLKNLTALDHEKIVQSEGLPFSYVINLMQQLSDIMKLYSENFIYQIEKVFSVQFEMMNREKHSQKQEKLMEGLQKEIVMDFFGLGQAQ